MKAQIKEIHCGDNLAVMKKMTSESVDLIYADSPFFSGKVHEVIWNDGTEVRSFKDTEWYRVECPGCKREVVKAEKFCPRCGANLKDAKITRKNSIYAFVDWLTPRLVEMHRILKPTGTIYVHLDWNAVHYIKVALDEIFGYDNFQNEIVWGYSGGGVPKKDYPRKHDTILRYTKTDEYTFNVEYKPYKENTKQVGKHSTLSKGNINIDLKRGTPVTDVWNDLKTVTGWSPEKLGYPTQKPEALLERIIKASSNPEDIVFDPFCGCGTSLSVANKLGRSYIGIDISPTSCQVIKDRINHNDAIFGLFPQSVAEYQKMEPNEFQNLVCRTLEAKNTSPNPEQHSGADGGIDGKVLPNLFHKFAGALIQVKRSKGVGVNVIKNFESTILHSKTKIGFVVALTFGDGAKKQAKEAEKLGIRIILIEAMELESFDFSNH